MLNKLLGRKIETLKDDIDIVFYPNNPDRMEPLEPHALIGHRFRWNKWPVEIIENTYLTADIRYIPFWRWTKEDWKKRLKKR